MAGFPLGHEFFEDRDSFSCGVFVCFLTPSCLGWSWKPDWSNKGMTGEGGRYTDQEQKSWDQAGRAHSDGAVPTMQQPGPQRVYYVKHEEKMSLKECSHVCLCPLPQPPSLLTLHPVKGVKGLGSRPLPGCSPPEGGSCSCRALHTGQSFINTCSVQRKALPHL